VHEKLPSSNVSDHGRRRHDRSHFATYAPSVQAKNQSTPGLSFPSILLLKVMGSLGEAARGGYLYKQSHNDAYLKVESASGIWLNLANGQRILDATCGAAVSSIGHGNARVKKAIVAQLDQVSYCHPGFFRTSIAEQLADFLVDSTGGKMARACITGSGLLTSSSFRKDEED
jgi:Aminotransferase class-III